MKKSIFLIIVAVIMSGCGDDKANKAVTEAPEVAASAIEVSQSEKRVEEEVAKHEEELAKDEKGFYYAYDEQKDNDPGADETFTRVDAQKRVKNRVVDGKVTVMEKEHKVSSPYQYVRIDLLKNALSKNFMVKCSACHDDYANGIIGPSLLEKDGNYIYGQLIKYRNDPSKNILMYELVNNMPEDELKALSHEVAEFNKEIRAIKGEKND
ncbi:MAG TPA: hypothetical protein EYG75_01070 [Campylobacterales bacterium]|nr:hypothetical protein [Campylobacterales bacterium]